MVTVCSIMAVGLVSLPFGIRRSKRNICRFPDFFINSVCVLLNALVRTRIVVYVDEEALDGFDRVDSWKHLLGVFGLCAQRAGPRRDTRQVILSNHQIYADWIYIWAFLAHLGRASTLKVVVKRAVQFIPFVGWVRVGVVGVC